MLITVIILIMVLLGNMFLIFRAIHKERDHLLALSVLKHALHKKNIHIVELNSIIHKLKHPIKYEPEV